MAQVDTYTTNALTELLDDGFGADLHSLDINEMLNILWDIVANIGDAEEEISEDACEAAKAIRRLEEPSESLNLILGLSELMHSTDRPLSSFVNNVWTQEASDTFGRYLEHLPKNDHSWILYCLLQSSIDTSSFCYSEEMEEIGEWLEINTDENIEQSELIQVARAIALMAVERFNYEADAA